MFLDISNVIKRSRRSEKVIPTGRESTCYSALLASIYTTWLWGILGSRRREGQQQASRVCDRRTTLQARKKNSSTQSVRRGGAVSYRLAEQLGHRRTAYTTGSYATTAGAPVTRDLDRKRKHHRNRKYFVPPGREPSVGTTEPERPKNDES